MTVGRGDARHLAGILSTYQVEISSALRQLITDASRGDAETGWHRIVPDLFDDVQIGWMAEEYASFVLPPPKRSTKGEMITSIKDCKKAVLLLWTAMEKNKGGAWSSMRRHFESQPDDRAAADLNDFCALLPRLYEAACKAESELGEVAITKGPQVDERPQKAARVAAYHYNRITQNAPARIVQSGSGEAGAHGPFVHFLNCIFSALQIDASADSHAQIVAYWWKNERDAEVMKK